MRSTSSSRESTSQVVRLPEAWGSTILPVLAVAASTLLAMESLRVLVTSAYAFRERSGTASAALLSLLVFLGPLLAAPLLRIAEPHRALVTSTILLAGCRLALQLVHPIPLGLAVAAAVAALVSLTVVVSVARHAFAVGVAIGLAVDASVLALFTTWDPVWQTGSGPLAVAIVLAIAAIAASWAARPDPSPGLALSAALIGPFLLLEILFLANVAFVGSATGASLWWANAIVLGGTALGAAAASALPRRLAPSWLRAAGGLGMVAIAAALPSVEGALAGVLVVAGQALAIAFLAAGATRSPKGAFGAGRTALAATAGSVAFLALLFLYQYHIDSPLPVPRALLVAVAAALLSLGGIRSAPRSGIAPPWTLVVVPAALFAVVPLALWIGRPAFAGPSAGTPQVRVVDFNVHSAVGTDGMLDPSAVADAILASNPDVVVLQEVPRGWPIAGQIDLARWLSSRLEMRFAWAPAADGQFGNVILTRFPMLRADAVPLPYAGGPQHRSYVRVELRVEDATVTVVGAHLQYTEGSDARRTQIRALLADIDAGPRTIVAGDMNMQPDAADLRLFTDAGLVSAQDAAGMAGVDTACRPKREPVDRPDWVFVSSDLDVIAFAVGGCAVSDHLPINATLG